MFFDECVAQYPIEKTIIGYYEKDKIFTVDNTHKATKMLELDSPLNWNDDYVYPFVIYNGYTNEFECWFFVGTPVRGYINPTGKYDDFYPALNDPEFGWEIVCFENSAYSDAEVFFPDIELYKKLSEMNGRSLNEVSDKMWMREQVAYCFDKQKYEAGFVFTSDTELKKFIFENF